MNSIPHLILGIWKVRMLSGFGFGHTRNIMWGICNAMLSISIYLYRYGISHLSEHMLFWGAVCMGLIFILFSPLWKKLFGEHSTSKNHSD